MPAGKKGGEDEDRRGFIKAAAVTAAAFGFTASVNAKPKPAPGLKVPAGHHLYFVTSNAVEGKDAEYRAWYIQHINQITQIPGFVSAQQLVYTPSKGRNQPPYQYMVIYEIDGDPDEVTGRLGGAVAAGKLQRPDPLLWKGTGSWIYSPVYPL